MIQFSRWGNDVLLYGVPRPPGAETALPEPFPKGAITKQMSEPVPLPKVERSAPCDAFKELSKLAADRYARHMANRESLISRFQRIQGVASLMVPCIAFTMPIFAPLVPQAKTLAAKTVVGFNLIILILAAFYVVRAILKVPGIVGNVRASIPGMPDFEAVCRYPDLDGNQLVYDIIGNYEKAIERIKESSKQAQADIVAAGNLLKKGVVLTFAFVLFTLMANVLINWRTGP